MLAVSVVVPALEEEDNVAEAVRSARAAGADEVVVVDGGSRDATVERARAAGARVVVGSRRGRGPQQNAGAAVAAGDVLLFLHADTRLPRGACDRVRTCLRDPPVVGGRFDVTLDGRGVVLRAVEWAMNFRSRWSGIHTGDQALFVRVTTFRALGGFEDVPLFEDVRFTRRLRRAGRVVALRDRVTTSARRWDRGGRWRTVLLMWRLRLAHAMGAHPSVLAERYRRG